MPISFNLAGLAGFVTCGLKTFAAFCQAFNVSLWSLRFMCGTELASAIAILYSAILAGNRSRYALIAAIGISPISSNGRPYQ
jgi:hypothetical protein